MKLRLPLALRTALLTCVAAVGGFVPSLATGTLVGGLCLATLPGRATDAPTEYDAYILKNGSTGNKITQLTGSRGQIWFKEDAATLSSWMVEFTLDKLTGGNRVLFATNFGTLGTNTERYGLSVYSWFNQSGVTIGKDGRHFTGADNLEFPEDPRLPVTLRLAYDAQNNTSYLYCVETGQITSVTTDTDYMLNGSTVGGGSDVAGLATFWTDGGSDNFTIFSVTDMNSLVSDAEGFAYYVINKKVLYKDFYWKSGSSSWSGDKWATAETASPTTGLPTSGTVNVIFNNNETATITMDGKVAVTTMSINAGNYTFQGSSAEEDSVSADTLSIVTGAGAVLEKITVTAQNGISNDGSLTIDGADVQAFITGSGAISVKSDAAFGNNVSAASFAVDAGKVAETSAILSASSISGHIKGVAVPSGQSDAIGDRWVEHVTLVERTAKAGVVVKSSTTLEDMVIGSQLAIDSAATLTLKGNIEVDASFLDNSLFRDSSGYYGALIYDEVSGKYSPDEASKSTDGNGFKVKVVEYDILTGVKATNLIDNDVTWTVDGKMADSFKVNDTTGVGTVFVNEEIDSNTYWVQSKDTPVYIVGDGFNEKGERVDTNKNGSIDIGLYSIHPDVVVMLKGGTLVFDLETRSVNGSDLFGFSFGTNNTEIDSDEQRTSTIKLTAGAVLKSEDFISSSDGQYLVADGTTLMLVGEETSIYQIKGETVSLDKGVKLGADWKGIVYSDGAVTQGNGDLTALTNGANSTVQVAAVDTDVLKVAGHLSVRDSVLLSKGISSVGGDMTVGQDLGGSDWSVLAADAADASSGVPTLTLGSGAGEATLKVAGVLSVDSLVLGNVFSAVEAKSLSTTNNVLTVFFANANVASDMNLLAESGPVTLLSLTDAFAGSAALGGVLNSEFIGNKKYTFSLDWSEDRTQLFYTATANPNFVSDSIVTGTTNGKAGEELLSDVYTNQNPQKTAKDGDLAAILNAVEYGLVTDEQAAAAAGSSTTALGMAFAGDVERQLRAIRNRTTTMGVNSGVVNEDMPYFNAWINAEGNKDELNRDGTMPGYTLDSWGGTVGFDADVTPNLTLGMAVTAMYGDVTVDGPDTLDGDMDTYYVSAFARYAKRAWSHTFVATVGKMDTTYERTVRHAGGSYMTEGDTDGTAFGLMYEVARSYTLDSEGDVGGQLVANVTYRHTTVGGYEETGSDAALQADDQTLDTLTFGVGGRVQAIVGENIFNRTSVLEARALAKFDVGDRSSEADVAFLGGSKTATVESAELGAFGVELGAGLSIPVGDENDGTIFFDVSAELRSGYTNVNGTLGYRINF